MLIKRECEHISKSRLRNVNLVHTERFRKRKPNFPLMFAVCQSYIDSSKNPFASSFGFAIPIVTPEQCLRKLARTIFSLLSRSRTDSLTFAYVRCKQILQTNLHSTKAESKEKIYFNACRLFFDIFRFRPRFCLVCIDPYETHIRSVTFLH